VKQVLVLGAGQSAPYLISYLLDHAEANDWRVTVGDVDEELARERVAGHARGEAIHFDANDAAVRSRCIEKADVVVNMLSPAFQSLIAWECLDHGAHMLSVSYRSKEVRDMDRDAQRRGILFLCELGLDPGIDHMSAMALIERVRGDGGRIVGFISYGSGIPAPDQEQNPLRYVITWNPRNVVMSAEGGAQYMEEGKIKIVPWHNVFHHTWPVEVDGVGLLEAYPNRDSLSYMKAFGLDDVRTMIRGTLRYPGWSETWAQIVRLGLPNESLRIPDLAERSYHEVVEMFLPQVKTSSGIEQRVASFLHISRTGRIMENLRWLGLFSEEKTGCRGETASEMLVHLMKKKLPLAPAGRDMVVLVHKLQVEYPEGMRNPENIIATLVAYGEPGGHTAMAKTVGLPTAIAAKLLLTGELALTGSHIPTDPSVYVPILRDLAAAGLVFKETAAPIE
jgi:saccharopine dehydrogenase (NADP+, L-glutamate forming)